jgi:hypothetical protein
MNDLKFMNATSIVDINLWNPKDAVIEFTLPAHSQLHTRCFGINMKSWDVDQTQVSSPSSSLWQKECACDRTPKGQELEGVIEIHTSSVQPV